MMNSRDYSYIDEEKINTFLKCPICSKPFVNPVVINNTNHACRSCVSSEEYNQNIVPITEGILLGLLNDLRVKCNKCNETNIRRVDLEQHMNTTCSERIVSCESADLNCSWTGLCDELGSHLQSCTFQLLRPIFTKILADINQVKEQKNENQIYPKEQGHELLTYDELKQEIDKLKEQEHELRYDELKQESDKLKEQYKRCETEIQELKNQNEEIEKENLSLKQEFTRINQLYNQQNNKLQTEIQQLKQKLIEQNTLCNELRTEIRQYRQVSENSTNQNTLSLQPQIQNDEVSSIRQLVYQHDIQIKLLARKKCVIPAITSYTDTKLEKLIEESLNNSEINLDRKQLIDHDIDVVCKKGIIEKKCTKLRLEENKITGKGAAILANVLYNNITLTELYLAKNQISDIGVHSLVQTLSINNSTLQVLDLHSNHITDEGIEYLADMLKINKTLIRLGLDFNQITDYGVGLLTNTIARSNVNLQWLSLASNILISDKSCNCLIEMLQCNQSLKTLLLNDCNFSTDITKRIKYEAATNNNLILKI